MGGDSAVEFFIELLMDKLFQVPRVYHFKSVLLITCILKHYIYLFCNSYYDLFQH